jgi:hypothetical protein
MSRDDEAAIIIVRFHRRYDTLTLELMRKPGCQMKSEERQT